MMDMAREFWRSSLFAFPLITVVYAAHKANIISHIKRDRPPDVKGACAFDAAALRYNIYNFAVFELWYAAAR